jgi:hypothetical protein
LTDWPASIWFAARRAMIARAPVGRASPSNLSAITARKWGAKGDAWGFRATLDPTVPLARLIFRTSTHY